MRRSIAMRPASGASVVGRQVLTPLDLERDFGLLGRRIFHGALTLDQLFSARPMLGYADYRGPIAGLYHCGVGRTSGRRRDRRARPQCRADHPGGPSRTRASLARRNRACGEALAERPPLTRRPRWHGSERKSRWSRPYGWPRAPSLRWARPVDRRGGGTSGGSTGGTSTAPSGTGNSTTGNTGIGAPGVGRVGPGGVPLAPGPSGSNIPSQRTGPGGVPIAPGSAGDVSGGIAGSDAGTRGSGPAAQPCPPGTGPAAALGPPARIMADEPGRPGQSRGADSTAGTTGAGAREQAPRQAPAQARHRRAARQRGDGPRLLRFGGVTHSPREARPRERRPGAGREKRAAI